MQSKILTIGDLENSRAYQFSGLYKDISGNFVSLVHYSALFFSQDDYPDIRVGTNLIGKAQINRSSFLNVFRGQMDAGRLFFPFELQDLRGFEESIVEHFCSNEEGLGADLFVQHCEDPPHSYICRTAVHDTDYEVNIGEHTCGFSHLYTAKIENVDEEVLSRCKSGAPVYRENGRIAGLLHTVVGEQLLIAPIASILDVNRLRLATKDEVDNFSGVIERDDVANANRDDVANANKEFNLPQPANINGAETLLQKIMP